MYDFHYHKKFYFKSKHYTKLYNNPPICILCVSQMLYSLTNSFVSVSEFEAGSKDATQSIFEPFSPFAHFWCLACRHAHNIQTNVWNGYIPWIMKEYEKIQWRLRDISQNFQSWKREWKEGNLSQINNTNKSKFKWYWLGYVIVTGPWRKRTLQ